MSEKLTMITNIKIKVVSTCGKCLTIKSFFEKITEKD